MLSIFFNLIQEISHTTTFKVGFQVTQNQTEETKTKEMKEETKGNIDMPTDWYLEIPCINLKASIAEGTTKEIMDEFIGHFEETPKQIGNIALAAHNRGYKNNYFSELKQLKKGDEIVYYYEGERKKYKVEEHRIIEDTDWSCLEETEENRITLITCVENEPNYRRAIQGIEEKERK